MAAHSRITPQFEAAGSGGWQWRLAVADAEVDQGRGGVFTTEIAEDTEDVINPAFSGSPAFKWALRSGNVDDDVADGAAFHGLVGLNYFSQREMRPYLV